MLFLKVYKKIKSDFYYENQTNEHSPHDGGYRTLQKLTRAANMAKRMARNGQPKLLEHVVEYENKEYQRFLRG